MAELNFGLLTPPGSQNIGNAFVQGMDQAAVARARENQNALSQYALSKAKREDQVKNQLLGDLRAAKTPEEQIQAYVNAGMGREAVEMQGIGLRNTKTKNEILAQPGVAAKTLAQTNAANLAGGKSRQDYRNQGLRDMANNPSDANIVAHHEDAVLQGMMTQEESDTQTAKLLAIPLDQRKAIFAQAGAPAAAPEKAPAPPSMVAEYTFAKTPDGGGFRGSFQDFVTARAAAGRAPAQPRPEQPPVAVVDPATRKPVYVNRDEAIRERMTPANAMEGLPPKEIQKREAKYPAATAALKGVLAANTTLAADLAELRDHPGLEGITGVVYGLTPSLTVASREAQVLYDKIIARGGFQELTKMRTLSPTGAALGPVSDAEGRFLREAFGALGRTQAGSSMQKNIDKAITELQGSSTRVQEAYDDDYAYRTSASVKPPADSADRPPLDEIFSRKKP
jgi:hypothetical protein